MYRIKILDEAIIPNQAPLLQSLETPERSARSLLEPTAEAALPARPIIYSLIRTGMPAIRAKLGGKPPKIA